MVRSVWHRKPLGWLSALVGGGLAVALTVSGVAHAQNQSQLQVFISALDASGKPVSDLKAEEVVMTENGAPGKVVSIEKFSLPVKLTITVDNGRDSLTALSAYRTGLTGLVTALPPDLEVTFITTAPQPRMEVRATTDREQLTRGIQRFGPSPDEPARFTDALVEYAERLDKDFKDKKLTYVPMIVMVSTSAPENSSLQIGMIEKGLKLLMARGAIVSVAMTTTHPTEGQSVEDMETGRQALIVQPVVKGTGGRYEKLVAFNSLSTVLPEWGKAIAMIHTKQTNQFRVVIDRPNGATGPLNKPDLRLTRPNVNGSVSLDGRYPQ